MCKKERYGRAIAVVGMQYGSEGKGGIVSYLSQIADAVVRTGGVNAGHTMHVNGHAYTMQQIPCGWQHPHTKLVIGVGAVIHLPTLMREIEYLEKIGCVISDRLYIDSRAVVTTAGQIAREKERGLSEKIGSSSGRAGYGIAETLSDRVLRADETRFAADVVNLQPYLSDTVELLNSDLELDGIVLFEGTQGALLSLLHGPYPYVTSRDTSAQSLFASAGVNPYGFEVEVLGVVRRYPIRVAGTSGPFGADSNELSWEEVAKRARATVDLREYTSVTGQLRRVAEFSWSDFERACLLNRPTELVLTFADHIDYSVYQKDCLSESVLTFIQQLEDSSRVSVSMVKTGPDRLLDFDRYRQNIMRRI